MFHPLDDYALTDLELSDPEVAFHELTRDEFAAMRAEDEARNLADIEAEAHLYETSDVREAA